MSVNNKSRRWGNTAITRQIQFRKELSYFIPKTYTLQALNPAEYNQNLNDKEID